MIKILTILGARPQFIKASIVSRALKNYNNIEEIIVHTGQHFDPNMSAVFFEELDIPMPRYQLNINSGTHAEVTAYMLIELEKVILQEMPNFLLVYGDTNSTLAGALSAAKLHIPIIHIEAGLRSFNRKMPEEINRIVTDQLSTILFCPTQIAINNLIKEGFNQQSTPFYLVGDVMQDAAIEFSKDAYSPRGVEKKSNFILATLHRAENTDSVSCLQELVSGLNRIHKNILPVILPLHPRTRKMIQHYQLNLQVNTIEPASYLEMLWCLQHCSLVLTDSGGTQKEAFFFNKPCVTMRDETEWIELVNAGVNVLSGANEENMFHLVEEMITKNISFNPNLYGGGKAAVSIAKIISEQGM